MLKKTLITLLILIVAFVAYVYSILSSTGFFREIENKSYGSVFQEIPLVGAEDLTIDYESGLMVISAFDRKGAKKGENPTGGIYLLNLNQEPFETTRLTDGLGEGFHPHGISLYRIDSARYRLLVVNHQKGNHTLELFDLEDGELSHVRSYSDKRIVSPNDIVFVDSDRFYFTNDHGYTSGIRVFFENYMGLKASGVVYYDGTVFSDVAGDIAYANGINITPDLKMLFVASPRQFEILEYDIKEGGSLELSNTIFMGTGVDNLEWDDQGNLWSGAHPNLIGFQKYAASKIDIAPSEVVRVSFPDSIVESLYVNDGVEVSTSCVAVPYGDYLFIGTVMDDKVLVLKKD
ncbi:MAG: hypothetical protein GY816_03735 [Cytophagales bacterium]|nr:hypothetical protein [Cytophagales bacterium]